MTASILLFVYRTAATDEGLHAKCVVIHGPTPSSDPSLDMWPVDDSLAVREMQTGSPLAFYIPVSDEIPSGEPPGTEEVYRPEPHKMDAPWEHSTTLLLAPNANFIVIEGDCSNITVPFFLTTEFPTRPGRFETRMKVLIRSMKELPEVVEYDERMEAWARTADKFERRMIAPPPKGPIRIPLGCYLPGTIVLPDGREAGVVYEVTQWVDDDTADVVIHSSDASVQPVPDAMILRRLRSTTGVLRQCQVGRLL